MAPKGSRIPKKPPPSPPPEPEEDPSEEIEEEIEEDPEEEEEEEEEEVEIDGKDDRKAKAGDSDEEKLESEKDEGEEEESDYPESPTASGFTVKPITPNRASRNSSRSAIKRCSEIQKDSRSRKRAKSSSVVSPGSIGRVWSEEDVISVLQGMIDYHKKIKKESDPLKVTFYSFVKRRLFAGITKNQLHDKVRRLKKKFLTILEKTEDGEDPVFSKIYDRKTFQLSKKIWGDNTNNSSDGDGGDHRDNAKSNDGEVRKDDEEVEEDFLLKCPNLKGSFDLMSSSFLLGNDVKEILNDGFNLIGKEKAEELEEDWKKLRDEEAEIFLKKMNLIAKQTQILLDARKNR